MIGDSVLEERSRRLSRCHQNNTVFAESPVIGGLY